MAPDVIIWPSGASGWNWNLDDLAASARQLGGRQALARWAPAGSRARRLGAPRVAHVHGERHDLWWEFTLEASFRWQAHLHRLRPEVYQGRIRRLTRALGIEGLLSREVASLTHPGRALADLAVALLPQPDLLLWEEPFYLLGQGDAAKAARLVRALHEEGMAVVALAAQPPGLDDLEAIPGWEAPRLHLAR
jgi:ABC-type uncharacterized transport system ATPase subunit